MPSRSAMVVPPFTGGSILDQDLETRLENDIIKRISPDRYNLWFRDHTKFILNDDVLTIGVQNLMCQEWLQRTFGEDVRDAVAAVIGPNIVVRYVIDPELFRAARAEQERVANVGAPSQPAPTEKAEVLAERPVRRVKGQEADHAPKRSRKWRHLSDFVVGPCNRVAHASAMSIVEEPGLVANPFVVYGPVGTGKTHLLEGIYAGLRKRWPDHVVRFSTAEDFTNAFVQTMHQGRQADFRKQFRDCSVLLLDDLNFLASKKATQ
ncbi:MAG: chromosome replication initiation protein, partial [Planctomycetes bacterium]|nr:chromosome replication initiation protein [Planctomycetota bacterium]